MFRLIGFIIGSAVSILVIVIVVGVPDFHWSSVETDQARFESALDKIREQQPYVASKAEPDNTAASEASAAPVIPESKPPVEQLAIAKPDETPVEQVVDQNRQAIPVDQDAQEEYELPLPETERHWHEFWAPFRSEIAARGFVARLEEITGLDYRISKLEAGVYQVGFAYQSDSDKTAHLTQISAATGLDLPQP